MRILVIEDERQMAEGIGKILESQGYQVDFAFDGESGLEQVYNRIYDLVLLDVMLPRLDGFGVLKAMRDDDITVPVILLTAKSQIEDKVMGLQTGADDYMTKPFDKRELLARINVRLKTNCLSNGQIGTGDLKLDPASGKLLCGNKDIILSKKEFELMEYLMINKNKIVSKVQIMDRVWGIDDESEYNSIEVYVSFLRKKLKYLESETSISTKKGMGYFLKAED